MYLVGLGQELLQNCPKDLVVVFHGQDMHLVGSRTMILETRDAVS
jgi:hypothetical protein